VVSIALSQELEVSWVHTFRSCCANEVQDWLVEWPKVDHEGCSCCLRADHSHRENARVLNAYVAPYLGWHAGRIEAVFDQQRSGCSFLPSVQHERDHHDQIPADHPDIEKVHDPQPSSDTKHKEHCQ